MAGPFGAAHVGTLFDVVIDGWGYRLSDSTSSHPFGTHRATYGYTPRFLPRTNIQGDYGDNFQDFWVTLTQRDWSLGEGQRHFRSADEDSTRRFWTSSKAISSVPGEVTLQLDVRSITTAAAVTSLCAPRWATNDLILFATSSNLYTISPDDGTIVDAGAHGASPQAFGIATDGSDVYITKTTGVRKWTGSAFSDFDTTTGVLALAYHNNSLYGIGNTGLYVYNSAGVPTAVGTWKDADGADRTVSGALLQLRPFGGTLLALIARGSHGSELWEYDGIGVALFARLPEDFIAASFIVSQGIAFVGGYVFRPRNTGSGYVRKPTIFYVANGSIGVLWQAPSFTSAGSSALYVSSITLGAFNGGICWTDEQAFSLNFYDIATGAITKLTDLPSSSFPEFLVSTGASVFTVDRGGSTTSARLFPDGTNLATSGSITTSLMDGDNSLTKHFHSIRIDGEKNGGTFDIAYQLDSLDGSWTTLQTGADPGTEYELPNDATSQGRSISVKVTLNRASATAGPTLRRVQARAAFILDNWNRREYLIELTGRDGEGMMKLRNDQTHDLDGLAQAQNLVASAESSLPITIHDRFGTFTGIVDNDGFEMVEIRPDEFIARVSVRET